MCELISIALGLAVAFRAAPCTAARARKDGAFTRDEGSAHTATKWIYRISQFALAQASSQTRSTRYTKRRRQSPRRAHRCCVGAAAERAAGAHCFAVAV